MAYFDEVYLKRVNKYGTNIQERIQNKKIHDFGIVLRKSPNKVTVFKDSETYEGILQNKTNSEKEVVDYLLTYKNMGWPDGTILVTENTVDLKQKKWLIFHLDEFVSIGYDRYQLIELDRDIQWIDNGLIYSEYVHFTGSGANLRDKSITSKFSIQDDLSAIYLPNKILNLVMKTNPKMKKGIRILIEDEVWKVSGIDKISVPGVSYITLEEDYIDELDDVNIANSDKLADWSIQSSAGDIINILAGDSVKINFLLFYNDMIREEPYKISIGDKNIARYENGEFTGVSKGETSCSITLVNSPKVKKDFTIKVSNVSTEDFAIIGPERIKIEGIFKFTIIGDLTSLSFESMGNNFSIISVEEDILKIKGQSIGKDKIIVKRNKETIFEKDIQVESLWMEG